jgi:urease accessory protein
MSPAPVLARSNGRCGLSFSGANPRQQLRLLDQTPPCRVLFPRPQEADVFEAAIVTTTGGLAGGDSIAMSIAASEGARVSVTTQAAEKVYRSLGDLTELTIDLSVEDGSRLEWMPQETILFNASRFRRRTVIDLGAAAHFLGGEMTIYGRTAHGEADPAIDLFDGWRLRRGGRLVWAENYGFAGQLSEAMASAARLAGARATTTLVATCPPEREGDMLDAVRGVIAGGREIAGGASVIEGVMIVRMAGAIPHELRRTTKDAWRLLRQEILGFGPSLPRVWSV